MHRIETAFTLVTMLPTFPLLLCCAWLAVGCSQATPAPGGRQEPPQPSALGSAKTATAPQRDTERDACKARIASLKQLPPLPGSPLFEEQRIYILGRARGEPVLWLEEPPVTTPTNTLSERLGKLVSTLKPGKGAGRPQTRLRRLVSWLSRDKPALRERVLRTGYVYSSDPLEAFALVRVLTFQALFDEPEIWLQRGEKIERLVRTGKGRTVHYEHAEGEAVGQRAELLLADRLATQRLELESVPPHHVDLRGLRHRSGFDRARVLHLGREQLLLTLRFPTAPDATHVTALIALDGARAELSCLDAPTTTRARLTAWQKQDTNREAQQRLRAAVTRQVGDGLRFDRPRGEEGPDRDGQLRPAWRGAYRAGRSYFSVDEVSYPVFDRAGRPHPPQVCVDLVLESFERASGTWYAARGSKPERTRGGVDFSQLGIKNRRGVIALGDFAAEHPEVFTHRRFEGAERVTFHHRKMYFDNLTNLADSLRAGDILAIRGMKRDGRIHQHAILLEDTDPLTGFPHALADQMKRPRRRSWEAIMAEAPKRSLYYHLRLSDELLAKVAGPAGSSN